MLYSSDERMTYDIALHRYVLTDDGFKAYSGYSLTEKLDTGNEDQDATVGFFLRRASENVYGILESQSSNRLETDCWLALPENREKVYMALCREASDMMANNDDPSESLKADKPICSFGLQVILEPLWGRYPLWKQFELGVDY